MALRPVVTRKLPRLNDKLATAEQQFKNVQTDGGDTNGYHVGPRQLCHLRLPLTMTRLLWPVSMMTKGHTEILADHFFGGAAARKRQR